MKRATQRFLLGAVIAIALAIATVPAFAITTLNDNAPSFSKSTQQTTSQTTAPATVFDAISNESRAIGYADIIHATVERLDARREDVKPIEGITRKVDHVPLY